MRSLNKWLLQLQPSNPHSCRKKKKERGPRWYPEHFPRSPRADYPWRHRDQDYVTCHFNFKGDKERGGRAIVIIDLDQIHNLGQTHCLFEQDGNSERMVFGGQLAVSTTQIDLPPPWQASALSLLYPLNIPVSPLDTIFCHSWSLVSCGKLPHEVAGKWSQCFPPLFMLPSVRDVRE